MVHNIQLSHEAREILGILVTGCKLIAFPTAKFYTTSHTGDRIFSWEAVKECQKEGLIDGLEITLKGRQWLLLKHYAEYLQDFWRQPAVKGLNSLMEQIEELYTNQVKERLREGS